MNCPQCGTENRGESNFCRFCGYNIGTSSSGSDSGYIPSVPPPERERSGFQDQYPPNNYQTPPGYPPDSYQVPPAPPVYSPQVQPMAGQLICPRCGSNQVVKGGIPVWAIVIGVLLALPSCFLSLLLLLVKDPHQCLNCATTFK
jgi:hypothetical protein